VSGTLIEHDKPLFQMTTAEVMTVSLVASAIFNGNQEKSRRFLQKDCYITNMLSKSQFNRRWHAIPVGLTNDGELIECETFDGQ
jgi:hypothetical protein